MHKILFIFVLLPLLALRCLPAIFSDSSTNENSYDSAVRYNSAGVKINQPFLWRTQKSNDDVWGADVSIPAIYDNHILVGGEINNRAALFSLNLDNGSIKWKNTFFNTGNFFILADAYIYKDKLVYQHGANYCIDIKTGTILWKNVLVWQDRRFNGLDSLIFAIAKGKETYNKDSIDGAYCATLSDPDFSLIYVPDLGQVGNPNKYINGPGGVEWLEPYRSDAGDIMVVSYVWSGKDGPAGNSWIDLYNFSKKNFVYQYDTIPGLLGAWHPQVYRNKLYHTIGDTTGVRVQCIDLSTGKEVWRHETGLYTGINGFVIAEGKLITTVGDMEKYVMALDVETGSLLWKTPNSGGRMASRMNYLNGVVYFTTATDARLHAVDASTGKYLWLMDTPAYKYDRHDYYSSECFAIPGKNGKKGKIIAVSTEYAYCFEAER